MLKRIFDLLFSGLAIICLLPIFLFIGLWIFLDNWKEPIFYLQTRVGLHQKDFKLIKFRSMHSGADKQGLLTIGADSRISKPGKFIRKYKLDELPQLLNVLFGQMSIVGPRPEVRKYVNMYNNQQLKVLNLKPGITDRASIAFINENEILAKASNPEEAYINEVMPAKLKLNLLYVENHSIWEDFKIIGETLIRIIR